MSTLPGVPPAKPGPPTTTHPAEGLAVWCRTASARYAAGTRAGDTIASTWVGPQPVDPDDAVMFPARPAPATRSHCTHSIPARKDIRPVMATADPPTRTRRRPPGRLSPPPTSPDLAPWDVVAIGALNIDYRPRVKAESTSAVLTRVRAVLDRVGVPYTAGGEHVLTPPAMKQTLRALGVPVRPCPAGSAFTTTVALARAVPALRLAYLGVAGYVHSTAALAGLPQLQALNVDCALVKPNRSTLAGICLCLPDVERTRLTCPGANTGMAGHLATAHAQIVGYLSAARVIHVTCLPDTASTAALRRVLAVARQANPGVLISIDPGHLWAASPDPNTSAVLDAADLLTVNDAEFRALGGGGGWLRASADALLRRLHPRALVAVKHPHGATVWRRHGDTVTEQDWSQRRLPDAQIVAPTGAGDVFAAGLLAGLLRACPPGMRPDLDDMGAAVRLGQAMARRHLRGQTTGPDDIPHLSATPTTAAGQT